MKQKFFILLVAGLTLGSLVFCMFFYRDEISKVFAGVGSIHNYFQHALVLGGTDREAGEAILDIAGTVKLNNIKNASCLATDANGNIIAGTNCGGGSTPSCQAGINYVGTDIEISDGTNCYIIADRNVGATEAGVGQSSNGHYFQWGNNYGFTDVDELIPNSTTPVNTNGLTTYNSSVWIYGNLDWSTTTNNNLRPEGAQGPCPSGYHIPTQIEWQGLLNLRVSLPNKGVLNGTSVNGTLFSTDLKLPLAGARNFGQKSISAQISSGFAGLGGGNAYYWSTTPNSTNVSATLFGSGYFNTSTSKSRANGFSLRCFKD